MIREDSSCRPMPATTGDTAAIGPHIQAKIAARDAHYKLIEKFGLADTPPANYEVRRLLEGLAKSSVNELSDGHTTLDEALAVAGECRRIAEQATDREALAVALSKASAIIEMLVETIRPSSSVEVRHGCHCDLDPDSKPDGCVITDGRIGDCVRAMQLVREGKGKWSCSEWKPINFNRVRSEPSPTPG